MDRLRVVVVDDEELARLRLRRLLSELPAIELVAECASGAEAVTAIRTLGPDVVFLDVRMPGGDGFGVLHAVGAAALPLVVFVTAYDEHAVRAFDVAAVDYVVKPYESGRIATALERVRARRAGAVATQRHAELLAALDRLHQTTVTSPPAVSAAPPDEVAPRERLLVRAGERGDRMVFVPTAEIDWLEAAGSHVTIHAGPRAFTVRERLGHLERLLPSTRFARVHRSTIVNLARVREVQPWFSGEYLLILVDGTQLKLSRSYRGRLAEWLGRGGDASGEA